MEIKTSTRGYELIGDSEPFAKVYADDVMTCHSRKSPIDHPDGAVTDEKIGSRTICDHKGVSVTASLSNHLTSVFAAVKDETAARDAAVAEEAAIRAAADDTEKDERISAIDAEAASRRSADEALSQSIAELNTQTVKTVNGTSPDSNGNVEVTVNADGKTTRTYRQCIVNGNFRRGNLGWTQNSSYPQPCTLSVTAPGIAVMTVPEGSNYYYYRTLSNDGKSGQKSGNFRYFLRIIISYAGEDTVDGWAYNGWGGVTMASFTLTKKKEFVIGDKTYGEYIGVCNNSDAAPYAFMLAPFRALPVGDYTILEQIAVELCENDALYNASADELYEHFKDYAEGQYVL